MFKIVEKKNLAESIFLMRISSPDIAEKAQAGQFVIIRLDEEGERIPLTIADFDRQAGTIDLVFQTVGKTTEELSCLGEGDLILDVSGPLGNPSEIPQGERIICVGGGVGIAPIYPIARAFKEAGNYVIGIIGARTASLLIYEEEMKRLCDEFYLTTDDGSKGGCALVTHPLTEILAKGKALNPIDRVVAIGPAIMMKCVADATRPHGVETIVSLNSIMVDGTGMCGACRVEVGGETRFACADGPEFDGHQVNFDLLMSRLRGYVDQEKVALEAYHKGQGRKGCQSRK
jgi:NAD(P)H-flavin reductase